MNEVMAIAENVWRRIFRMKVVYFLIACAVLEIGVTSLYEVLMAREHRALMVDTSLLLTTLSGLLCVLALAFDIPKELRAGAASALLSKPLGRTQYLIGKYVGITWVAVVVSAVIAIGFCIVHKVVFNTFETAAVQGHVLAVASVVPMAAVALFFASLLGEALAAILTTVVIWLSHSTSALAEFGMVRYVVGTIIPEFNIFNLRAEAYYYSKLDWLYIILAIIWAIVYSVGVIAFTGILFNNRDLR